MTNKFFNGGLSLNYILEAEHDRVKNGQNTKIRVVSMAGGEDSIWFIGTVQEYFKDNNLELRKTKGARTVFCTLQGSTGEFVISVL